MPRKRLLDSTYRPTKYPLGVAQRAMISALAWGPLSVTELVTRISKTRGDVIQALNGLLRRRLIRECDTMDGWKLSPEGVAFVSEHMAEVLINEPEEASNLDAQHATAADD